MITIDLASAVPLTSQIEQELRRVIATGAMKPGQELPAVRQLAGDLEVNFNTVARAYRMLETSGLVRTSRGRGTFVSSAVEADEARASDRAIDSIRHALVDARLAGLGKRDVREILLQESAALWSG